MSGERDGAALRRRLMAMPERLRAEAQTALQAIGTDVAAAARDRLRRSDGTLPSAPGEPPRDRDGRLAGSISVTRDTDVVSVLLSDPVATYLEYGTQHMAARPFLRPAVEDARPAALAHCRAALARAARSTENDA